MQKVKCVHFVFQKLGCDFNLSNKQSADVVAFISMMEEKLLPALVVTLARIALAYMGESFQDLS